MQWQAFPVAAAFFVQKIFGIKRNFIACAEFLKIMYVTLSVRIKWAAKQSIPDHCNKQEGTAGMKVKNKAKLHMVKLLTQFFLLATLLVGLCIFYGFQVEPNLLLVRHFALQAGGGESAEKLRLVQISDIQIGEAYTVKNLQKVVRTIQKQQPDVILFNGDLFEIYSQCGAELEAEVTALLKNLEAPYGKYAVWGNRDYGGGEGLSKNSQSGWFYTAL